MAEGWSQPDAQGVSTRKLEVGARVTLRGRQLRRALLAKPGSLDAWPGSWRELAAHWLKSASPRRRWETLLKEAGPNRMGTAQEVLAALLKSGWVEVEETREAGRWVPLWVRFLESALLRRELGLPDRQGEEEALAQALKAPFRDPQLKALAQTLAGEAPRRALERAELLRRLDQWLAEERFGTRRDFALYARGATKAVSGAEWKWLDERLDLARMGIERHTPLLAMRLPVTLYKGARELDLRAVEDCVAFTPETLKAFTRAQGSISRWRVIENRTSFERIARSHGAEDGVLWVPGFPPQWWRQAVAHLLALCPAPALIACDPDPAGIEIALQAGALWQEAGLSWEPWNMDCAAVAGLSVRRSLNDDDAKRIRRLLAAQLPPALAGLAQWMLAHGEKGEQEGIT